MWCGLNPSIVRKNDLFEVLKEQNHGSNIDNENGYSYFFQNIGIGIYREIIPKKIEEMIEEPAKYWSSIGTGVSGYAADATAG